MKRIVVLLIICSFLFVLNFNIVNAYKFSDDSGIQKTAPGVGYDVKEKPEAALEGKISLAIRVLLSLLGVIFLIILIYGGFLWMTSRGNEQEITRAKSIIQNSIIGLAIVIAAYAITYAAMSLIYWEI